METEILNPFAVTKAVEFSDDEIQSYWVELPGKGGLPGLVSPRSKTSMLVIGAKGSGKTHLMRYLGFSLQRVRHCADVLAGVKEDGYLGIYLRCEGLNSSRFSGKGLSDEAWTDIFAYYFELWLAQLFLEPLRELFDGRPEFAPAIEDFFKDVASIFDQAKLPSCGSIADLISVFERMRREIDSTVNNLVFGIGDTKWNIATTRGRLVFDIPRLTAKHFKPLKSIQFLYLVDEYENLSERQQQYVNTLIREKSGPCSFRIGARLYGIKTRLTFSNNEEIKEGSECETLLLDSKFRDHPKEYSEFARRLVLRRLQEAGFLSMDSDGEKTKKTSLASRIDPFFRLVSAEEQAIAAVEKYANGQRPYFKKLRASLEAGLKAGAAPGVSNLDDIEDIIETLKVSEKPILEKVNIFQLYKEWNHKNDLKLASVEIAKQCARLQKKPGSAKKYHQIFKHFDDDMLAQLLRETGRKPAYEGLDTFIKMSSGMPRNLITTLKHIFGWAVFNGEKPFSGGGISERSELQGVREASNWFFSDAQISGRDGELVRAAISRLGTLFRDIRFSDKPPECSVSSFSANLHEASEESRRIIKIAEEWSLLLRIQSGQRDRNSSRVDSKFQLNRMLCPIWDLGISRGGTIAIDSTELNAIFDHSMKDRFEELSSIRTGRMRAPYFGKRKALAESEATQPALPGL